MRDPYTTIVQTTDGRYNWGVFSQNEIELAYGDTDTVEQAVRDSRNFIKNNQNLVYDGDHE